MHGHIYTEQQDAFIRAHYSEGVSCCVTKFNKRFGTQLSYQALKTHANRRLKIATGLRPWTDEQNKAITEILQKYPYKQAVNVFNRQFGMNYTQKQIQDHCTRRGIKRNYAAQLSRIDEIITENIDKPYAEIRQIIGERTGKQYSDYTAVCVRANNLGLKRPHRVWQKNDKRMINGEPVTFSEFVRFIGNRWHRIAPELQPIALQIVRLQALTEEGHR
jgi:hypothetical protein